MLRLSISTSYNKWINQSKISKIMSQIRKYLIKYRQPHQESDQTFNASFQIFVCGGLKPVKTLQASKACRRTVTVLLLCIGLACRGPRVQVSKCFLGGWQRPTVPVTVFPMWSSSRARWAGSVALTLPWVKGQLHPRCLYSLYCEALRLQMFSKWHKEICKT